MAKAKVSHFSTYCFISVVGDSSSKMDDKNYFLIFGDQSGRVLDASLSNIGEVVLWDKHGGDNQLWFWYGQDRDVLKNKKFPNKVLDFHWGDYQKHGWGKVYLHEFNGGWNQKWQFDGRELVCKGFRNKMVHDLRLDVNGGAINNGAKVGVYQKNGNANQRWQLQGKHDFLNIHRYYSS